ncbi:MAG: alpha-amylase family glycosyl hydrolase, partial [Alphaproteobacteria bacterium]
PLRHRRAGTAGVGLARFDPACPFAAHGGDLAGVIDRLDYLAALGVGAILLSPLNLNGPEGYHGYHPVDLYAVEPRLGDLAAVQALVQAAHRRGLAVLLDQVLNHVAPMLDWRRAGEGWRGVFRYDMADARHLPLQPEGLRDPACFHDPSTDGDDVRGRLFGFLDDWRAEREDVAAALVRSLKYWLAATDADGFRYDAVRHVEPAFWRRCTGELRRYAAAIGKTGFRQ